MRRKWTADAIMTDGRKKWGVHIYSRYESCMEAKAAADKFCNKYNTDSLRVVEICIYPSAMSH